MIKAIDSLPDRELTTEEFRDLQSDFEQQYEAQVYRGETGGIDVDVIIITMGETDHVLHYTEERGWHTCGDVREQSNES